MIAENFGKFGKLSILKIHKKKRHKQNAKCLVFFKSTRQVCNHLYLNLIKNCTQNAYFLQKFDFCIFNQKIVKW